MALCVAAGGEREAKQEEERRRGERARLCGLGVKTDRLLMESSKFRCSAEVLEHGLKY